MTPKIMILVPSFGKASPIYGAFLFANYLHKHGFNVVFVSLDDNYEAKVSIIDEISDEGIVYRCLNVRGWWGLVTHWSVLRDFVKTNNIDVIVSYLLRPNLAISMLSGVVKISSVRDMLRKQLQLLYGEPVTTLTMYLQKIAWRKMDRIWCLGSDMHQWLVSEGLDKRKISIVNNFVDVKRIRDSVSTKATRDSGNIEIGIFCKLYLRKRVDTALRALAKMVHGQNYNIKLHIAGDGILRESLVKMAKELEVNDNVVFHGFVPNPLDLMNRMDLVILTSEAEGVPRSLMEALSLGKTVVASEIAGVRELIVDGQSGYLFPVGDFERLAALISDIVTKDLYLNPESLVDFMMKNYDANVCCEVMLNQIRQLCNRKPSNLTTS